MKDRFLRSGERGFLLLIVLFAGSIVPGRTQSQPQTPVVVELFTSQGCSDCPAADDLLNAMARGQSMNFNVIPLAFHVTYWDHDGWRDRFSDDRYTQRQQDYQGVFHSASIYTPQAVIDGEYETVGNNPGKVFALIRKAAVETKPANVEVRLAGDSVTVTAKSEGKGSPKVWLAITEDDLTTEVKAGENKSRTLRQSGVVREIEPLGKLKDGSLTRTVPLKLRNDWQHDKLHAVAFVQDSSGKILGAGTAKMVGAVAAAR